MTTESRGWNVTSWILQWLLAALFAFAGVAKLMMSAAQLEAAIPLPAILVHVVSILEILGALGLVLPGLLKRWTFLTPLAAIGLAIIMAGASVITAATMGVVAALMPLLVLALLAIVAWARWTRMPLPGRRRPAA